MAETKNKKEKPGILPAEGPGFEEEKPGIDPELLRTVCEKLEAYCSLEPGTVTPDCSVITDLGVDSLALAELLDRTETDFGITVPDIDIPLLRSPLEIAEYIQERNAE